MTTTYYASITADFRTLSDVSHAGTSATAGDVIELRMGNGTTVPSRSDVLWALETFERWIIQGGLDQAGANLPPPAHASG